MKSNKSLNKISWCPYIRKQCGNILHIFDPSLSQNYFVIIGKPQREVIEIAHKQLGIKLGFDKECDGRFWVINHKFKGRITPTAFIWSGNKVATIVHECFHAVWWSLNRKGILITKDNDEALAYHLEFLVKAILEK